MNDEHAHTSLCVYRPPVRSKNIPFHDHDNSPSQEVQTSSCWLPSVCSSPCVSEHTETRERSRVIQAASRYVPVAVSAGRPRRRMKRIVRQSLVAGYPPLRSLDPWPGDLLSHKARHYNPTLNTHLSLIRGDHRGQR